jgi:protein-L-isoaspartate(D-aspartate) O-methyltransferase
LINGLDEWVFNMVNENKYKKRREFLVERFVKEGILKTERCINAFKKVPREKFVWIGFEDEAYYDTPLPLGSTGQTISAPHMCAYLIEELELEIGNIVFEVGGGSGYQAALIAECIAPSDVDKSLWGHVYTMEINKELYEFAKKNIRETKYDDRVTVLLGDGSLGYPPLDKEERYDRILLTAAAPKIPSPLLKQLKTGGILIAPIGRGFFQDLIKIIKTENGLKEKFLTKVAFVPLRGKYGWQD